MMGQDSQAPSTGRPGNQATVAEQQSPEGRSEDRPMAVTGPSGPVPFPLQAPPMRGVGTGGELGGGAPIRGTFELMTRPHLPMPLGATESLFVPNLAPRGTVSAPLSPQGHHSYQLSSSSSSLTSQYGPRASSVPIPDQSAFQDPTFGGGGGGVSISSSASRIGAHSSRPHIPNIVIEQVSARDSFGHSRTPPFTHTHFSPWQLGIPGNGRKNRTNSDSALYDVEREQQQQLHQQSRTSHASATITARMPVLSPSLSSERLLLEHIRIADSPTKDSHSAAYQFFPSSRDIRHSTSAYSLQNPPRPPGAEKGEEAQRVARQISQGFVVQEQGESAMETDSSDPERQVEVKTEGSEALPMSRDLLTETCVEREIASASEMQSETSAIEKESETVEKPTVPFLWKFQPEKQSLSQSPKTFWLRRHSDSNLPTQPQNLTVSHEQRSHSTGESHEPLHHHRGDERETSSGSEAHKTRDSTGDSFRSSLSESTEASDYRTDPNWSAKRMKLKKKLLQRYQLQSEESPGSGQHSLESDDVFSPSPGVFSARTFSFSPERIHSLQEAEKSPSFSQREAKEIPQSAPQAGTSHKPVDLSSSLSVPSSTSGDPTEFKPGAPSPLTIQPSSTTSPYAFSVAGRVGGKPVRPLYVKTESSSSGGDAEEGGGAPETPVFFSPHTFPQYYDSPRQTGSGTSVFQFQSPSHSRSPSLEKSDTPSPPSLSTRSPYLHSPSPLSVDTTPPPPSRPPFHRSPSPLSQDPAPQGPASSQVTKKAALVRDISPGGSSSGGGVDPDITSPKHPPRILPHSPRETQSPIGPYIMPTIKEHSQPQGSATMAAFSVTEGPLALSRQPLSASAPAGFLSFRQAPQSSGEFQILGELKPSPQGTIGVPPLEAMLRHPSFTLSQLPTRPKHFGAGDPEKASKIGVPFADVKPVHASTLVGRGATTATLPPFQTYSSSEAGSKSGDNTGLQWVPSMGTLAGENLDSPSPSSSRGKKSDKSGDASKIIYCPFSEKVQEQRYQQDPHQNFVCPVCGQMFPSFNYLANHMVNHLPSETITRGGGPSGEGTKIHICKVCNKSFSRSDMLTRHMRLHTGLRPYECRICGQVFSRSDHLHTHMRTHTGEKPYRCPQCPYAAPRRDMITRHMRIHMKPKRSGGAGRRNSSTGSADTQQSSFSSQESADLSVEHLHHQQKRHNQSLSSLESASLDSPMEAPPHLAAYGRHASTGDVPPPSPDYEGIGLGRGRHWSVESGASSDIVPSPSTPGFGTFSHQWDYGSKKQHSWSATSMEIDLPPAEGGERQWETKPTETILGSEGRSGDSSSSSTLVSSCYKTSPETIHKKQSGSSTIGSSVSPMSQEKVEEKEGDSIQQLASSSMSGDYHGSIVKTEPVTSDIAYRSTIIPSGDNRQQMAAAVPIGLLGSRLVTSQEVSISPTSYEPVEIEGRVKDETGNQTSSSSQKEAPSTQ